MSHSTAILNKLLIIENSLLNFQTLFVWDQRPILTYRVFKVTNIVLYFEDLVFVALEREQLYKQCPTGF
jgi:hypothetical protein